MRLVEGGGVAEGGGGHTFRPGVGTGEGVGELGVVGVAVGVVVGCGAVALTGIDEPDPPKPPAGEGVVDPLVGMVLPELVRLPPLRGEGRGDVGGEVGALVGMGEGRAGGGRRGRAGEEGSATEGERIMLSGTGTRAGWMGGSSTKTGGKGIFFTLSNRVTLAESPLAVVGSIVVGGVVIAVGGATSRVCCGEVVGVAGEGVVGSAEGVLWSMVGEELEVQGGSVGVGVVMWLSVL